MCYGTNISPLIRNCDISGNSSAIVQEQAAAIYSSPSWRSCANRIRISDCNITGNTSSYTGGGIYIVGWLVINRLHRSLIAGNVASGTTSANGGGIYAIGSTIGY